MGALGVEIKARVSLETKTALAAIAAQRREGTNISDILREAIGEYLERQRVKISTIYPQLRVAEDPLGQ